jgi:hypothetical protein
LLVSYLFDIIGASPANAQRKSRSDFPPRAAVCPLSALCINRGRRDFSFRTARANMMRVFERTLVDMAAK